MFVAKLATTERSALITKDMEKLQVDLESYLEFLIAGAEVANGVYSKAIQVGRSSDQKMMELSWSVVGFEKLVEKARDLQLELRSFVQSIGNTDTGDLTSLKSTLLSYLKETFCCLPCFRFYDCT